MITALNEFFLSTSNFIWTYLIVGLCVVVGIYCTLRLVFVQFRCFGHAVALLRGQYEDSDEADGITTFQALATALSGTTGIGVIAGVAVAIKLGGPGAIFWMWMMALVGMALKYMEATLGSLYRVEIGGRHEMGGGPMHYITRGLSERWRPVAVFYAACTAIACLGAWNMFQANQAAATLQNQMQIPTWFTGLVLSIGVGLVLVGGIKRIGMVAARLVPAMGVIYVSAVLVICLSNLDRMPAVLELIINDAFQFDSAGGGVLGTAILIGIRRAVFSNEAGCGSAAIAHAAAHTQHPVRQGIVASLGPFIDTVIVCAATAFVILLSGYYGTESYQNERATVSSFEQAEVRLASSGNWSVISEGIPTDGGNLQRFTDGERVLSYHSGAAGTVASPIMPLGDLLVSAGDGTGIVDGIRFSAWSDTGSLQVRLHNRTTGMDISLPVYSVAGIHAGMTLEGGGKLRQWGSFVILPDKEVHAALADESGYATLELQFVTEGKDTVYIDRVELVSDVTGIVLSTAAFSQFFGLFGGVFIPIAALFFAYTTILAGNYYGEVACHYLNEQLVRPYLWLYIGATFVGCVANLDVVINFSDLTLGLMTVPNLIAITLLTPVVVRETRSYFSALKAGELEPAASSPAKKKS